MRRGSFFTVMLVVVGMVGAFAPPARATNDPKWKEQYGPIQIQAHAAWAKATGKGVIVAVVDSGVDDEHPDLKANLLPGRDFASSDMDADDDADTGAGPRGHGTHVAGTIAAVTNNNEGVAGVAPDAKILPVKVFRSKRTDRGTGGFTPISNDVSDAIRWSVEKGAKVINLSLGGVQGDINLVGVIESPCFEAFQQGALCVVAAGNDGKGKPSGYQRDVWFLTVTANNERQERADFGQNADTKWSVSAPGVAIMSTYPVEDGKYTFNQGTSMAAPHAAGAAALLFSAGFNNQQVVDKLMRTATASRDAGMGAGIINVGAALGADPLPDDRFGAPVYKQKAPSAGAAATTPTRPAGSGGSGLPKASATAGNDAKRGLPDAPGAETNSGEFDFSNPGGAAVAVEEAGSEREKAEGIGDTTMLGILAGFLLLGVVIPVAQAWSRRGLTRS